MRKFYSKLLLGILFSLSAILVHAQVTVSGGTTATGSYSTLSSAITALNAGGVPTAPIVVDVIAGHTETLAGKITLTLSGTLANTITIQKSGSGANPVLTSYVGTVTSPSTIADGFFVLAGSDYVTIDGIDLMENTANTTTTTVMEFGYGLFKASATDGCQNNTIKNCKITLNRIQLAAWVSGNGYTGSTGIVLANATNIATTALTVTAASGSNSNNKIYSNTFENGHGAIAIVGFAAATPFTLGDTNNDIGGSSAGTGNTILNFAGFATSPATTAAIYTINQWGLNVSFNTINNNNGAGLDHPAILRGIFISTATSASVTCNNNVITLKSSATSNQMTGIECTAGATAASNTINILNNIIQNCARSTAGTTGTFQGINLSTSAATINVNSNRILSNSNYGSGQTDGILIASTPTTVNINNNNISNNLRTTVSATASTFHGIYTSGSATNVNMNADTVSNNTINVNASATSTLYAIRNSTSILSLTNCIIDNNQIIYSGTSTSSGNNYGYYNLSSPTVETFTSNRISNLSISGTSTSTGHIITGIYTFTTASSVKNWSLNNIFNLNHSGSGSCTVTGIRTNSGNNIRIYKNKIYDLNTDGTASLINGILVDGGTNDSIYNNLIGNLTTPFVSSLDAIRGISITSTTASSNILVYYNTIYLNATSTGTDFGTSGIYHVASATGTTANLSLRNNNIANTSTPNGTGLTVAIRRTLGTTANSLNNFNTNSNNNNFYVGIPSGSNVIYYDGTNFATTLNDYKNFTGTTGTMAPRGSVSISEDPEFQSTIGANANFLKYKVSSSKGIESGGANIATFTDDFTGTIRAGNTGYAGTGTAPDMGAWELEGIPSYTCTPPTPGATQSTANNLCIGQSITLSLANLPAGTGITYQWQSSTNGTTYSNISGAILSTYTTTPTTSIYYQCVVTCQAGPNTAISTPIQITFANNITSTTPGSRCGTGTVNLSATGNTGTTIKWYDMPSGGGVLATGGTFTTPTISTTTNYYASAGVDNISSGNASIGSDNAATKISTTGSPYRSGLTVGNEVKNQYLITAAELSSFGMVAGNITALTFIVNSVGSGTMQNLTFKIGNTSLTSMTTTYENTAGFTTVLVEPTYTATVGNNLHTFSSPFNWDGFSNIVVEVCGTLTAVGGTTTMATYTTSVNTTVGSAANGACANTTGTTTSLTRPVIIFTGQVGSSCYSPRVMVTATVTPAPTLTISGNQTICNNSIATISVTSNTADFNTYQWSPAANLYTDAAATVAYVAGSSATTVYYKSAIGAVETITCTANNTSTNCSAIVSTVVTNLPASPTVAATTNKQQCLSGSATFGLTPATGYGSATIQWQSSTNNSLFNDISGANATTYTTPSLTATTYYRVQVKIGGTTCATTNSDTLIVNNPSVVSKVDSFRCGTGTVTLKATGSAGTTLNWYTASTGGSSIATGSTFVTPTISSTTNYYVSASVGGSTENMPSPTIGSSTFFSAATGWGLRFTVNNNVTINSVVIKASNSTAGAASMQIRITDLADVVLYNGTLHNFTISTTLTEYTIPVNINVPPGNYKMVMTSTGISNLVRESGGVTFPYTAASNAVSITAGANGTGTAQTTSAYYWFYNWVISTGCESARTMVTATVNPSPAINITPTSITRCPADAPTSMTASSTQSYNYTWSPNLELSSNTGATVSTSATVTRTYTVTGDDGAGCIATKDIVVTVNTAPSAINITPSSVTKCAADTVTLTASGGTISDVNILSEGFETGATGWTFTDSASTGSAISTQLFQIINAPYTYSTTFTNFSMGGTKFAGANADVGGSGSTTRTFLTSPTFSTIGFSGTGTLTFKNLYQYYSSGAEQVKVQITNDGGATWTDLIDYNGANVGVVTTNAQVPATSTLTIPAQFMGQPNVQLRWRYISTWGYYWMIDDISLKGNQSASYAWSPNTSLTTAIGNSTRTFATSSVTYTLTATNTSNGCTNSKTVGVTITPNTSITYLSGGNIQSVDLGRSINAIKYKVTNGTGSSSLGLPNGVTATLNGTSDTITISGTPTQTGVYNYKVIATGLCKPDTLSGTITVDSCTIDWGNYQWPPSGSINQCGTYTVYGQVYKAGYTEAPGQAIGMQAWFAVNTSNTNPATWPDSLWKAATFNVQTGNNDEFTYTFSNLSPDSYFIASRYKLPCSNYLYGGYSAGGGGPWNGTSNVNATLTVTVGNTAGAASSTPTVCINTAITNITHTTTGATGIGTATGLPSGLSASWASNTITISGTPTASGTFNYSIPLTGGCGSVNATGTITVTANNTAGAASSTPTVCINTAITNITHTTTGATGIGTATGLPSGVSASWASNTITISGTPTASGTFNYSIPLTGGCGSVNATGTITVTANNTAGAASSTPTVCINTAIADITHTTTGATGIGTATGLPSGVSASWASNTITISGTPTASGTFNYSIPLTGGCGSVNATGTITVNAKPAAVSVTPNSFTQCTNSPATKLTASGGVGAGSYEWSPITGLFIDAAATTAYSGGGRDSVFARPGVTTKYTATSTNAQNCSSNDTSLITVNCTLPVNYLSFAGVKESVGNVLRWTTSTEQNNKGFDVERSIDGRNFSSIGYVASKGDNGNSNHELNYSFIDNQLSSLIYYYRLRQIDLNGKTNYSNTIVIKGDRVNTIKLTGLYPNPATEEVTITIDAPNVDKVVLLVTDIYGKQLVQQQMNVEIGSNNTKLNIGRFAAGTYVVRLISTKTNESSTIKFVKQ